MDALSVVSNITWGCLHTEPVITWNSFSSAQSGRAAIISYRPLHNCCQHHSTLLSTTPLSKPHRKKVIFLK